MQTLQVECHTHQTPFASGGLQARQRELAKAQDVFDNAQHRFDCTFSQAVDCLAKLGLEFICHLNFRTGIRWWWRRLLRKIRLPTGMMGCPSGGDVRLNVTRFYGRDVGGAEVPIVQGATLGLPEPVGWRPRLGWPQLDRWDGSTGCWPQSRNCPVPQRREHCNVDQSYRCCCFS